jgi:hypothetical protein
MTTDPIINVYPPAGTPGWVNGLFIFLGAIAGGALAFLSGWLGDKRKFRREDQLHLATREIAKDERLWEKRYETYSELSAILADVQRIDKFSDVAFRADSQVDQEKLAQILAIREKLNVYYPRMIMLAGERLRGAWLEFGMATVSWNIAIDNLSSAETIIPDKAKAVYEAGGAYTIYATKVLAIMAEEIQDRTIFAWQDTGKSGDTNPDRQAK